MAAKRNPIDIILRLLDRVSGPADQMKNHLKDATAAAEKAQRALDAVSSAGKKMAAAGLIVAAGLGVAGRAYAQDETALIKMKTAMTGTSDEIEGKYVEAVKAARQWTGAHGDSIDAWSTAAYRMQAIGLQSQKMIEATNVSMQFAKATFGDAATAGNVLTITYDNFADKTQNVTTEMTRLADQLTATQQAFNLADLGQLAAGYENAVGAANSYRVATEQTLTVLGRLNNAGIQGANAGTAYAAIVGRMAKASEEFGFEIAKNADGGMDVVATLTRMRDVLGESTTWSNKTREALATAFGEEVALKIPLLTNNVELLNQGLAGVGNSAGKTAATVAMIEGGLGESFARARVNGRNLLTTVFTPLAPTVARLADSMASLAQRFSAFADTHPRLAKMLSWGAALTAIFLVVTGTFAMVAAGFGHMLLFMTTGLAKLPLAALDMAQAWNHMAFYLRGTLIPAMQSAATSAWGFAAALAANPITWIVVGVALAALQIYLLVKHFDRVKAWLQNVPQWAIFAFQAFMGPIGVVYGAAATLIKAWDKVKAFFAGLAGWWAESGRGMVDAFFGGIRSAWDNGIARFRELLQRLRDFLTGSDAKVGPLSDITKSGRAFTLTYAHAIESEAPALAGAATRTTGRARTSLGGGGARRGGSIGSITINVNGGGSGTAREVRREMESLIRSYGLEVG